LKVYNALALEPWHFRHEDIVFALGLIKDPSSVPVLPQTALAKHPYLENDEFFALGSKSIYALENIQTPEAIRVMGELAKNENEVIREIARKRLNAIAENGLTEANKAAAKAILEA
jgi:HEAT repeat protein